MSEHTHSGKELDHGLQVRLGRAPREPRQVVKYTFFALDPAWRRLPAEEREAAKAEFARVIEESVPEFFVLRSYNLIGMHHDTDFMLWSVGETLEGQSALLSRIYRTALGAWLRVSFSYLALTKHSQYVRDHVHEGQEGTRLTILPDGKKYLFVYPLDKKREWYSEPFETRNTVMREHIKIGHRYATVVVEMRRKRVLWIGPGRGREDLRPFFELMGPEACQRVQAVVMDMNTSYDLEVRLNCPQAAVVYDLFHVVAKYGREVIDRVRVDEANRLRHDKKARKVIKSARWLLLRNRENVKDADDQVRLAELLKANRALMTVYVLKDDLKALWSYRHPWYAKKFWDQWYRRALRSRIEPLRAFAKRLAGYLPGILAHCQWPLGTNLLEGINNKIKVIKRMAYGFRDEQYFFLKIRAAYPGNR
mgnify:CR=1 FL=1